MTPHLRPLHRLATLSGSAWLILAMVAGVAVADDRNAADPAAQAQLRYLIERAACDEGPPDRDREACRREAAAAFAEARGSAAQGEEARESFQRNAEQRCEALPGSDRSDCLARMRGQGTTEGSVESGGIYREFRTRQILPAEPRR